MAAVATMAQAVQPTAGELCGVHLGVIERRFGLLSTTTGIRVASELGRSADLAATDRIAFVHAMRSGSVTLVVEADGWYCAVVCDEMVTVDQIFGASLDPLAPRLMSVVSPRGITPVLGALAGQA